MTSGLEVRTESGCLVVELNRARSGNSIDDFLLAELEALVHDQASRKVGPAGAVIITGVGDRFFCAGGDLRYLSSISDEEVEDFTRRARKLLLGLQRLPAPTVAVINGYAIGGGLELALACDFRLARQSAQMSMPQLRLGLIPGWHGIERLRDVVGARRARELLLSGRSLGAKAALDFGLVDEVTGGRNDVADVKRFLTEREVPDRIDSAALIAAREVLTGGWPLEAEDTTLSRFIGLWSSDAHREAEDRFAKRARRE